jgi:hypothetical protein
MVIVKIVNIGIIKIIEVVELEDLRKPWIVFCSWGSLLFIMLLGYRTFRDVITEI